MNPYDHRVKECDVLIIGGGGSGALASLEASKHEHLKIILISKGPVGQSGLTPTANGGTKAAGSPDEMFKDMITGGSFLNDQDIVWFMVSEIQHSIEKMKQLGIHVTPLRGKSVCVPSTETLKKLRTLIIKKPNIELLEDVLITRLLKCNDTIAGATAIDLCTGEFFIIKTNAVIIATGGFSGELYPHTSNNPFGIPTDASGTGHIMAYLAGAELIDMEMIQFVPLPAHPRCLYLRYFPEFWAGPYTNRFGEIIESNVASYVGESYSYLFVQRLFREFEGGRGPIFIDQRGIKEADRAFMIKSWDQRRKLIKSLGIDPHDNKIELLIGSHFGMGGIRVNKKTETTLPGLYAAGEVMGGVHGGMRLSGYSFTQMIVFGFEAGKEAAKHALETRKDKELPTRDIDIEKDRVFQFFGKKNGGVSVMELKRRLQQVMGDHVFVFRVREGLLKALCEIRTLKNEVLRIEVSDFKRFNIEWIKAIEFSSLIEAAEIIVKSALVREESRGFHYRRDFPQENREWLKHTVARWQEGSLKIDSSPVVLDRMRPKDQA